MRLYIKTLKLFCKTPSVIIPYVLLLAAENIFLYRLLKAFIDNIGINPLATPLYFMNDATLGCFLIFIFFVFISFGFMRKIREASLEETLAVAGGRGGSVYGLQILVLWTAALIQALNVSVYFIVASSVMDMSRQFIMETVPLVLTDFVLLPLASVGIGVVLSGMKRRLLGYGVIILLVFLTLPGTADILLSGQRDFHIPVFVIRDFVCLLQPNVPASPDPLYGLPAEWYRQAAMLFWILLLLCFCSWKLLRREKRARLLSVIVLAGCMAVMGYGVLNKGSVLLMTGHPESALEDSAKYNMKEPVMEEEASFSVSSYVMDLSMKKELVAEVGLSIRQKEALPEYVFTLYHSYRVKRVTDQSGNELPFRQEEDSVRVDNENLLPVDTLHFSYQGHSPAFYTNSKACFLPGFFPYYPRAGRHAVYELGFLNTDSPAADYQIRVTGLRSPLYSNLQENGGVFTGTADQALLVSGYCATKKVNGVTCLYYPFQEHYMENIEYMFSGELEEEVKQLYQFLGMDAALETGGKMLVAIPDSLTFNSVLNTYYDCGDYILYNEYPQPYEILMVQTRVAAGKEDMKSVFFAVMPDSETDLSDVTLYKDEAELYGDYSDYEKLYDTFILKMKELGVQYVAQKTYQYLVDDGNQMGAMEFLNQLS